MERFTSLNGRIFFAASKMNLIIRFLFSGLSQGDHFRLLRSNCFRHCALNDVKMLYLLHKDKIRLLRYRFN